MFVSFRMLTFHFCNNSFFVKDSTDNIAKTQGYKAKDIKA